MGARPVLERGEADLVHAGHGRAGVQQVLQRRPGAAGPAVPAAVRQRVLDAKCAERLAAVELAADELVGGQVTVGVQGPGHLAEPGRALERRALGAGTRLREARADAGANERVAPTARADRGVDRPDRRPAAEGRALATRRQVVALGAVQQVLAERGRLHPERLGLGQAAGGAVTGHVGAGVHRLHGEAPARQRVARLGPLGGGGVQGDHHQPDRNPPPSPHPARV